MTERPTGRVDAGRPMVEETEWDRVGALAAPTRSDYTVVLSGGKRATLAEVEAYVAADLERRAAAASSDG